ncbi:MULTISPECIES: flagellar hook-associated protein FlgK [Brevibacillus]|uniref:flagellar hook-associated protein FlgK n=1 Tax=Brevibacillus TaxID=55080 RepID=UPI000F0A20A5|nr:MULTISPECIES: flagellar hook-associated protein FlgK [Brevibacillus]MDR7317984.1 flagellar hook-associated protein 1 FlgK [Brevibacillus nitrificans]MEC2130555.1 flagellar hook-associated protein FlgK [Brevibacillus centrosporus]RNB68843.1 flagellar hook-associated protein FlgK [Brevibacillus centrosporus]GED33881.1 flagellar hook-associated protein 1 [Brevibacillus centrosporus]
MTSTFHGIEVNKRGLFAQQTALNTTAHNVSNANTAGYTRQRVNLEAANAIPVPGLNTATTAGQLGTGVQATEIQRMREVYLDNQYRSQNKHFGYYESKQSGLTQIEGILNEPSDNGLQNVMDKFWQSWEDLSQNPQEASTRSVVVERALAVSDTFTALYTQLSELQNNKDEELKSKVQDVNSIATQIADLNSQINKLVPSGYQPNDLYDKRDLLIDKLSKLADTKITNAANGMVNVTIDGQPLVTEQNFNAMVATENPTTGLVDITLGGAAFTPISGSLAGIYENRSGDIPQMMNKLDILASNFTRELNKVHREGVSITDLQAGNTAKSDIPFFVDSSDASKDPTGANKISVNPLIRGNLNNIATAKPASAATGDGSNALDIAKIKYQTLAITNADGTIAATTNLDDYYRYTISELGTQSQEVQRQVENTELMTEQIESQRQSVSGVSIDEEMAEMVKYQSAYSSSARMMTTVDEMLDKLINGMGRVGL